MEQEGSLPADPSERRKVQNRNAQRKFRHRRHQHQVNRALQFHDTVPSTQTLSWPLLVDDQVLAGANPLPSQQIHVAAPQCDLSGLDQQLQAPSKPSYWNGTISASQSAANQANLAMFPHSASDLEPMAMSYLASLDDDSPMLDRDIASAFTMPTSAFTIPLQDNFNPSPAISGSDYGTTRTMVSTLNDAQASSLTSLPPLSFNARGAAQGNTQQRAPPPVSRPSPGCRTSSPDHLEGEANDGSNSIDSSDHASPASSNGVTAEVTGNDTMSVLHIASHRGHTAIVSTLLSHDLDPNEPDGSGTPPLHLAAINGHATVISLLLSQGARINVKDSLGRTALHWALLRGREAVVKVFLDAGGADLNLQDRNGWSALHVAAERGSEGSMSLLLRHGADLRLKARKCEVWKKGEREIEEDSWQERVRQ